MTSPGAKCAMTMAASGASDTIDPALKLCGNSVIAEADRYGYPLVRRLPALHGGVSIVPALTARRVPLPWRA